MCPGFLELLDHRQESLLEVLAGAWFPQVAHGGGHKGLKKGILMKAWRRETLPWG